MALHPAVAERLRRLAPDQRAAATAPRGPVLCVAPAGSGKTTTLVTRIAWLVASGAESAAICALTFNRRAAEELSARLDAALREIGQGPGAVRVRTFHALGLEILRDAGERVELADRTTVLAEVLGRRPGPSRLRRLDDDFSRLKLDLAVDTSDLAADVAADERAGRPVPVPIRAFLAYESALAARGRSTSTTSCGSPSGGSRPTSPCSPAGAPPPGTC
jgi:superfamily I DNA/RNA helicase